MNRNSATWWAFGAVLCILVVVLWRTLSSEPEQLDTTPVTAPSGRADSTVERRSNPAPKPAPRPDPATPQLEPLAELPTPVAVPVDLDEKLKVDWIFERCDQLIDSSYERDLDSLHRLLAELDNKDETISQTAYESLMARHDKRAIPHLQRRLANTPEPKEKIAILELIESLGKPSITEMKNFKKNK